jgi:allantoinase
VFTIRSRRVVLPAGIKAASLQIEGGRIAAIAPYDIPSEASATFDAGSLTVSPGIVDSHVHINEPGRTEWEGFDSATRAAAAGGITTLIDMPLNSIPATTTPAALADKRASAEGKVHVDVGFWGGIVPGNAREIAPLVAAGVRGFKCFLAPSGVAEFERVREEDLRDALPHLSRFRAPRVPLLVHAENPRFIGEPAGDRRRYQTYLHTRPPAAEVSAIRLIHQLCLEFQIAAHIVHVSSEEGVAAIADARAAGIALTAETCPHYLAFNAESIPDGATEFKCAPPIRERRHRDALWKALHDGVLQLIATDHSPSPPAMKQHESGDVCAAWGGIASLQLSLPAVWTEAHKHGADETDLARWMSHAPAALAGLSAKGSFEPGKDADVVVWDPLGEQVIQAGHLWHRHQMTPYAGRRLRGLVHATFLRGRCIYREGRFAHEFGGALL